MDFVIKLLHIVFFGGITFIIFKKYNRRVPVKPIYIGILLLFLVFLIGMNTMYKVISNTLLFMLLMFSFSVIVLNVVKNFISLENKSVLSNNNDLKEKYKRVRSVFFEKIIPVMVYLYQVLLILLPPVFERMSHKH
jgi:4-hydroxybenzoate polyprenyltransferase